MKLILKRNVRYLNWPILIDTTGNRCIDTSALEESIDENAETIDALTSIDQSEECNSSLDQSLLGNQSILPSDEGNSKVTNEEIKHEQCRAAVQASSVRSNVFSSRKGSVVIPYYDQDYLPMNIGKKFNKGSSTVR